MVAISRRMFLASSLVLPAACTVSAPFERERLTAGQPANTVVRPAAVGQSWQYARYDSITGELIGREVERVGAVGDRVSVDRFREYVPELTADASWGAEFLQPYRQLGTAAGDLPAETQRPWGMVLVDAHWGQVQVYRQPIPLWPSELRSGWRTFVNTEYKTPNAETGLSWQQTMKADGWERIRLSAGEFTALRYTNRIVFTSSDFGRYNCVRDETLWFAPEVGRWIARVSGGTFYHNDSALPQPFNENHFRWELLSWS